MRFLSSRDKDLENYKKEIKEDTDEKVEKDDYFFEVGFHIAFNQVIYTMVLLYSFISPIITLLGATYFTVKYFVDKYNQTMLYPKHYDSKGELSYNIMTLGYCSLAFQ